MANYIACGPNQASSLFSYNSQAKNGIHIFKGCKKTKTRIETRASKSKICTDTLQKKTVEPYENIHSKKVTVHPLVVYNIKFKKNGIQYYSLTN